MSEGEEWRVVPKLGHTSYEVSSLGNVRSWKMGGRSTRRRPSPKRLKLCRDRLGYERVVLRVNGASKTRSVHALVMESFVGPRPDGQMVCHKDGNPSNNQLSNLYYGTMKQNQADSVRHGTRVRGERVGNAILTDYIVRQIRNERPRANLFRDLARQFEVTESAVRSVFCGEAWSHVGGTIHPDGLNKSVVYEGGRVCSTCRQWKHLTQFGINRRGLEGRRSICKHCVRKRDRESRAAES